MKPQTIPALVLTFLTLQCADALAGPFGLNKGMTVEQVKKMGNFIPGKKKFFYRASNLVKGHPDFEGYSVVITPQHGLCKITAIGRDITASSFGSELESKYKEITGSLTRKYGEPANSYNYLRNGSIWKDPQDWMMALVKKERVLASYWVPPENTNLPDGLFTMSVTTSALSQSKGYVTLSYEFDNADACLDSIETAEDANL